MSQYQPPAYQPPAYQPPQPYQPPPQQPYPYYQPQPQPVQHVVHYHQAALRSPGLAAVLEIIPGFFQFFGIGHIYAGNVGVGLLFMFGYWLVQFINVLLCFVLIGFITGPLCFLLAMIISPIVAANAASRSGAAYR